MPRAYVLVHGAWHGGWCWRRVADILAARGHRVLTPTLTGLGERSHLLSPAITLDTHIADVVNVIRWEDLGDVVLVGHSYGGWPISGAAEQVEDRIASIVFVDAFLPADGERLIDLASDAVRAELIELVARGAAGRPVPDAASFMVVRPEDAAWVQERMTPQPVGVALNPIRLTGARERIARKTYVRATSYPQPRFAAYYDRCRADAAWRTFALAGHEAGHDIMVDAPERLAQILEEVA